ncbi:hypothetical protein DN555_03195 [Enterobacter asburiae]|uniref:Uncharacterized protein n=1 Tax=Enterobacter cloacae TaxID=550 RepID=A0A330GBS2_ENTCL|nr:hypothetical protein ELK40_18270 [Enterobacter sp. N18-03635]PNL52194.1 hypothetical protein CEP65_004720 [Enterobacter hormaechei]POV41767.1 hypothetical protein C3394_08955 [Enterobacter cloacae complex sp. ECNIH11]POV45810.1 hypothetical protein C3397_07200 [Enterobacter cloacae complex sp. ECNIH16]PVU52191.1 hypothetical protein CP955_11690 [Enterobacter sp. HN503E2II]QBN11653.1 hypothetical protein E2E36_17320 [Enterobacter cloacae complex sp.]RAZ66835.1 hypothetical protein DP202_127
MAHGLTSAIIQTVTNCVTILCRTILRKKCGTFARDVAASLLPRRSALGKSWDDDAVFQGAGWVN